jgi:hypothetical protein
MKNTGTECHVGRRFVATYDVRRNGLQGGPLIPHLPFLCLSDKAT